MNKKTSCAQTHSRNQDAAVLDIVSVQEIFKLLEKALKAKVNRKAYLADFNKAVKVMGDFNGLPCYTDKYDGVDTLEKFVNIASPSIKAGQVLTEELVHERIDYMLMTLMVISQGYDFSVFRHEVLKTLSHITTLSSLLAVQGEVRDEHHDVAITVTVKPDDPNILHVVCTVTANEVAA